MASDGVLTRQINFQKEQQQANRMPTENSQSPGDERVANKRKSSPLK